MFIFFDTTVLGSDRLLTGASFDMLSTYIERTGSTLHVHKLSVEEAVWNQRRTLEAGQQKILSGYAKLEECLGRHAPQAPDVDINSYSDWYRAHVESRLGALQAKLVGYEGITHDEMVLRATGRIKPFNANGNGFRDSLIWLSLLHLVQNTAEPTAFISNDNKAFCSSDRDGRLHKDLVDQLCRLGLSIDRVQYYCDLQDFIDKIVKPSLKGLDDVRDCLNAETYEPLVLGAWLQEHEAQVSAALRKSLDMPREAQSVEISCLEPPEHLSVTDVVQLTDRLLCIEFEVEYTLVVDFIVDKHDYYLAEEVNPGWGLIKGDWNETFVLAYEDKYLGTKFRIEFDVEDKSVIDLELVTAAQY